MRIKFQLFIQDHAGDHNYEWECFARNVAEHHLDGIRAAGGYWISEGTESTFVPWHRIDFARISKIEE